MSQTYYESDLKRLKDWIKENVRPEEYDYWSDYWAKVKGELPQLSRDHPFYGNPKHRNDLKKFAHNMNPEMVIDDERRHTSQPESRKRAHEIDRKLPSKRYFTIAQFAREHNLNYNTTRREFQQLYKEKVIISSGKGRKKVFRLGYQDD